MPKTLTKPDDIRQWAEARAGAPMSMDMPDGSGEMRTLLNITFGQHALNADENEGPDRITGFELTSWDEWVAELEKQGMAIRVRDESPGQLDNEFEFVARDGKGKTTNAAKKPAG
jgi:hypothetical protein